MKKQVYNSEQHINQIVKDLVEYNWTWESIDALSKEEFEELNKKLIKITNKGINRLGNYDQVTFIKNNS